MDGLADMSSSLLRGANATAPLYDMIGKVPGLGWIQEFISHWVKLDITAIAAAVTILGTLSGVLQFLRTAAIKTYWWITRFFTASVSINARDKLNREVLNWVAAEVLTRQGTRVVTARSEKIETDAFYYRRTPQPRIDYDVEKRKPIQYLPTFGSTWFVYDWNVFIVRRVSANSSGMFFVDTIPDEFASAPEGTEPLVVMCLGRSVEPVKRFLDMCREFGEKQREAYVTIRASRSRYDDQSWETTILRPIRPIETIHFDEKAKAELVADLRNYLDPATRRFYTERGIPYRRGYLMHGPAGTGKTSLSLALAGLFGLELYLLHVPSVRDDQDLEKLFTTLPPRCFVLLEDIDAVGIKNRGGRRRDLDGDDDNDNEGGDKDDDDGDSDDEDRSRYGGPSRVTLSGLLNVLDGVASQEGRIVLMTSNYAERLDRALVRPGRIDKMIYLGFISQRSAELMFKRMYARDTKNNNSNNKGKKNNYNKNVTTSITNGTASYACPGQNPPDRDELEKLALSFSGRVKDNTFTPAQLQGYLLNHRQDPRGATDGLQAWMAEEMAQMEEAKRLAREAKLAKRRRKQKQKQLNLTLHTGGLGLVGEANNNNNNNSGGGGGDNSSGSGGGGGGGGVVAAAPAAASAPDFSAGLLQQTRHVNGVITPPASAKLPSTGEAEDSMVHVKVESAEGGREETKETVKELCTQDKA